MMWSAQYYVKLYIGNQFQLQIQIKKEKDHKSNSELAKKVELQYPFQHVKVTDQLSFIKIAQR